MANIWWYDPSINWIVAAYVGITGDETGEKLVPAVRKGSPFYPYSGEGPYDINDYLPKNSTQSQGGGNYTLPKVQIPTSRYQQPQQPQPQQQPWWFGSSHAAKAAYYYMHDTLANEEEQYEQPWTLQILTSLVTPKG